MKKIKRTLALLAALTACTAFATSLKMVTGSAELIVPDDYEYEDSWDDSYLLDNLEGEQTIDAEGTPPAVEGETEGGCGSTLAMGSAVILLTPALGMLALKKKKN